MHALPDLGQSSIFTAWSNRLDVALRKLPFAKDDTRQSSIAANHHSYAIF
jgi:hypothetical protein